MQACVCRCMYMCMYMWECPINYGSSEMTEQNCKWGYHIAMGGPIIKNYVFVLDKSLEQKHSICRLWWSAQTNMVVLAIRQIQAQATFRIEMTGSHFCWTGCVIYLSQPAWSLNFCCFSEAGPFSRYVVGLVLNLFFLRNGDTWIAKTSRICIRYYYTELRLRV